MSPTNEMLEASFITIVFLGAGLLGAMGCCGLLKLDPQKRAIIMVILRLIFFAIFLALVFVTLSSVIITYSALKQ